MLCITTTPGSAVESNGSMFCMIGGAGNLPSKMARTKSMPGIEAMTSVGVTPYSIGAAVLSSMEWSLRPIFNDDRHTTDLGGEPATPSHARTLSGHPSISKED